MSKSGIVLKLGILSVVVPATGFVLGLVLRAAIPGCKCDEGAGCSTCAGFGEFIGFLMFGGFSGAFFAAVTLLPASLLMAVLLAGFGTEEPHTPLMSGVGDPSLHDLATVAALKSFQAGESVVQRCVSCGNTLEIKPAKPKPGRDPSTLRVTCSCGKSNGTYEITPRGA